MKKGSSCHSRVSSYQGLLHVDYSKKMTEILYFFS